MSYAIVPVVFSGARSGMCNDDGKDTTRGTGVGGEGKKDLRRVRERFIMDDNRSVGWDPLEGVS